MNMTKNFFDVP